MTPQLLSRSALPLDRQEQMYTILDAHFSGVSRGQFLRDLDEKNWVILLVDSEGRLQGFTTLLFYETVWKGERLGVVYSGDTIVQARARNTPELSRAWIGAFRSSRSGSISWSGPWSGSATARRSHPGASGVHAPLARGGGRIIGPKNWLGWQRDHWAPSTIATPNFEWVTAL